MTAEFVVATCDVRCSWNEFDPPPRYRCYVNDELFTERTWIWRDVFLEESFQILAEPGKYRIRYEIVDPDTATIDFSNLKIVQGPALLSPDKSIRIYTP
jgi:hypothetical protein